MCLAYYTERVWNSIMTHASGQTNCLRPPSAERRGAARGRVRRPYERVLPKSQLFGD